MIAFEHVTTKGKGFRLQDVSFRLEDGYIMALAGENGAGKTTLLKHILETNISYQGRILIDGMDMKKERNACLERIALVSDGYRMPVNYTVQSVCDLYRGFYNNWNQEILEEFFRKMGVLGNEQIGNLSRGGYFRMQLALGLAHRADVFLMDEATSGMDPVFRRELWRFMRDITAEGADILLVTHILDEIRLKCDYRGILEEGRLVRWEEAGLE
ncbi:ABC transporter ATP-binding protein [bacterium D16-51]|nr:ABC transporter ATP-binding protein [bacterium D16-59]RKI58401.1 ABC transporter ATP-binding protein [bacterium D16-51]